MTVTTSFFENKNHLSNLIFPYLDGSNLGKMLQINKNFNQAAKVDALWEELYIDSFNFLSAKKSSTWREEFILETNWQKGLYIERPVERYPPKGNSGLCITIPMIWTATADGLELFFLEDKKTVFLKASGYEGSLKWRFLFYLTTSPDYVVIKTDHEIEIYSIMTGDLLRKIPIANPYTIGFTTCVNGHLVASLDGNGENLNVWDILTGRLVSNKKFKEKLPNLFYFPCPIYLSFFNSHTLLVQTSSEFCKIEIGDLPLVQESSLNQRRMQEKRRKYLLNKCSSLQERSPWARLVLLQGQLAPETKFVDPDPVIYPTNNGTFSRFSSSPFSPKHTARTNFQNSLQTCGLVKVWNSNSNSLKTIFFKKLEGYRVSDVAICRSKILLQVEKLDQKSDNQFEWLVYDFHPSGNLHPTVTSLEKPDNLLPSSHQFKDIFRTTLWSRIGNFAKDFFLFIRNGFVKIGDKLKTFIYSIYNVPRKLKTS